MRGLSPLLQRFRRGDDGAALVEFALSLPLILILAFGAFEAQRLLWGYQAAVAAVRDATRYVARVADGDICDGAGPTATDLAWLSGMATTTLGRAVVPGGVTVTGVAVVVDCEDDLDLRQAVVPRARVTADLRIALPFTTVFTLAGGAAWDSIDTSVVEEARIYGL